MKNTEAHLESASGRLAAYLDSHKDAMTNEWGSRACARILPFRLTP